MTQGIIAMTNDRLRDTARSRLSSVHNEAPASPRVQCDGCQQIRVMDARLGNAEALQRSDSLDLAELTGSVMASIEGLRRETSSLSVAVDSLQHNMSALSTVAENLRIEVRNALGLIDASRGLRTPSDSFPVKTGQVEAKLGDKWRFRSSSVVAIVITIIVVVGWVAKDWSPASMKQQTTQSGK